VFNATTNQPGLCPYNLGKVTTLSVSDTSIILVAIVFAFRSPACDGSIENLGHGPTCQTFPEVFADIEFETLASIWINA